MSKIIIKKEKEQKILNFYPNVYKDEIKDVIGNVKTGDIVDVITNDMKFLAKGYVTEGTSAFVRILTTKDEKIDRKFIFERIKNAYEKRKHLLDETNSVRAFYSEADFIPGLIIDKFDKYVSIQFRNSGVEVFKQDIIEAVKKYLKPKGIYERSDVENRIIEGVETKTGIIFGEIPKRTIMVDNGVKYNIDIVDGQKTGFFLDQRDSRKFIAKYINNQTRFLDVFSNRYISSNLIHIFKLYLCIKTLCNNSIFHYNNGYLSVHSVFVCIWFFLYRSPRKAARFPRLPWEARWE